MAVLHSEALTLRTYPYSESHRIAVFLSREFGQVRGIAHGARKAKSRFAGSLEPLTQVRLTFSRKEHQELAVIQNCEIIRAFPAYRLSWEVNLHFSYFAELLLEFSRHGAESERLYRLAAAVLEATSGVPIGRLARYFELWLLKLEGVLPRLDGKLPAELAGRTQAMLRLSPGRLEEVELSEEEAGALGRLAAELIEYHLEKPLKSRKMLQQLL